MLPSFTIPLHKSNIHWVPVSPVACISSVTSPDNGIVKEGSIPDDWKSSVVLPIYKGKGDPMECGSYRGIKLLEHAMKV